MGMSAFNDIIYNEKWFEFIDAVNGINISCQDRASGTRLRPHWHERIEIWWMKSGEAEIKCGSGMFKVGPGDIAVFAPFEVHSADFITDGQTEFFLADLKNLKISGSESSDEISSLLNGERKISTVIKPADGFLYQLFERLEKTPGQLASGECSDAYVRGIVLLIIGMLLSFYSDCKDSEALPSDELSDVINYMYTIYDRQVTLDDLSGHIGFSRSYFCRWFKERTGTSPMNYINDIRVKRAYELLMMSDLSVSQVCEAAGFADINSMNLSFKKRMGISPSQCRKKMHR